MTELRGRYDCKVISVKILSLRIVFFQGHAKGNRTALLVRSVLQSFLKRLGRFTQRHCGKVILFGFLFLIVSAIGLIKAQLETNAENLWIEGVLSSYLVCCFLNNSFDFTDFVF